MIFILPILFGTQPISSPKAQMDIYGSAEKEQIMMVLLGLIPKMVLDVGLQQQMGHC